MGWVKCVTCYNAIMEESVFISAMRKYHVYWDAWKPLIEEKLFAEWGDLTIDLFADTAAILISIVSNSYYGMLRGQIHINLPPEHPIMSFETIEINMAAISAKRSIPQTKFAIQVLTVNDKIKFLYVLFYFVGEWRFHINYWNVTSQVKERWVD